jgi:hypothetical protein
MPVDLLGQRALGVLVVAGVGILQGFGTALVTRRIDRADPIGSVR